MERDVSYLELHNLITSMHQDGRDGGVSSAGSLSSVSSSNKSLTLSTPPPPILARGRPSWGGVSRTDDLCETLQKHMFVQDLFPQQLKASLSSTASSLSSSGSIASLQQQQQPPNSNGYEDKSRLDQLSKSIAEIDKFITASEELLRRDLARDEEFYARERQRKGKHNSIPTSARKRTSVHRKFSLKEGRKVDADDAGQHHRYHHNHLPVRATKSETQPATRMPIETPPLPLPPPACPVQSRLHFQNGKVGCVDPELQTTNCVQKTHELVRQIIGQEHVTPLVALQHVDRVLFIKNFRRDSTIYTEDFEMTNVRIGEHMDDEEKLMFSGAALDSPTESHHHSLRVVEPEEMLCDRACMRQRSGDVEAAAATACDKHKSQTDPET